MKRLLSILFLCLSMSVSAMDNKCSIEVFERVPSQETLIAFAKQTAMNAYSWHHEKLNQELSALQHCFSVTGWQSFMQALTESKTLKTIKDKSLVSNPSTQGNIQLKTVRKNKEWIATIPLNVHYENDSQELTQQLLVSLSVTYHHKQLSVEQVVAAINSPTENKEVK